MHGSFQPLDEAPDVIDIDGCAEIERRHLEWSGSSRCLGLKPRSEGLVDDGSEGTPGRAGDSLQAGRHVIIEGQGRSHWHIVKSYRDAS